MATLTVAEATLAGATHTLVAAASGGDQFSNDGKTLFIIKNAHATNPRTVTFDSLMLSNFETDGNIAVVVAALTTVIIGPFSPARFNNQSTGRIGVTYSDSAADLTVQAVKLGRLIPG